MIAGPTTRNGRGPIRPGERAHPGRPEAQEDARRQTDGSRGDGGVAEHTLKEQALEACP